MGLYLLFVVDGILGEVPRPEEVLADRQNPSHLDLHYRALLLSWGYLPLPGMGPDVRRNRSYEKPFRSDPPLWESHTTEVDVGCR